MAIDKFEGEYRWLSNFWPSPVSLLDGFKYPTIEHAYQAAKSPDILYREKVAQAPTPTAAKRLGKKANLRPDWEKVKFNIMASLIHQKFQDPELRAKLIATLPQELIEGNWWGDRIWGVCKGVGENHLGKLLMDERARVKLEEIP